jgi:hypothetical protein
VHVTGTYDTSAAAGVSTAAASSSDPGSDGHGGGGEAAPPPRLITNAETTDATVPGSQMTEPARARLAGRGLLPAESVHASSPGSVPVAVLSRCSA